MLLDANVLLYARNADDPRQAIAGRWLEDALNGTTRVAIPWHSLSAFVRIATHPRVYAAPLTPEAACEQVREWLAAPAAWTPMPTDRHAEVFCGLVTDYRLTGPLVADAHLAALAIEHGLVVASTDADFDRFKALRRIDPLLEAPS